MIAFTPLSWLSHDSKALLGSVRAVTLAGYTVMEARTYDAWGVALAGRGGLGSATREGYTGKVRDTESTLGGTQNGVATGVASGLDYFGARTYAPAFGRFLQVDPLEQKHPEATPYNYVLNSPLTLVDPDGRQMTGTGPNSPQGFLDRELQSTFSGETMAAAGRDLLGRAGHGLRVVRNGLAGADETLRMLVEPYDYARTGVDVGRDVVSGNASWGRTGFQVGAAMIPFLSGGSGRAAARYADEIVSTAQRGAGTAYREALSGGRHAGFLRNSANMSESRLRSGIQSFERLITEHRNKIASPTDFISNFRSLDPRQQRALLESEWPRQIQRQIEQRNILQGILNTR